MGLHLAGELGKIRAEADQLPGFLRPEAFAGAQIADGLQKIGLTLGVIAYDQIHARLKGQRNFAVIAKILQL